MRGLRLIVAMCVVFSFAAGEAGHAGNPLVDPPRPTSATDSPVAAPESGGVHVQAIVIRADSRIALVDGHVVRAGDRIANVFIEEVTPEGVRYSQDGHSRFARLKCPTPLPVRRSAPSQRDLP